MTDSPSDTDTTERRFERRSRSVRPPRRPRSQTTTGSEDTTQSGQDRESESPSSSSPATDTPAAMQPVEAQQSGDEGQEPEETATADLQTGGKPADDQEAAGQANEQQPSGALSAALQQQIADAIAPMVGDLQQQIADAVRQRAQGRQPSEQETRTQVDEAPEQAPSPAAAGAEEPQPVQQLEQQEPEPTQHIQEQKPQSVEQPAEDGAELSPLQAAIQRTVSALRETLQGLVRTVKALFQTVKALLTAVVGLLQIIVLGLGKVLAFIFRPLARALGAAVSRVWNGLKALLMKLVEKIVLSMLRSMLLHLLQRLSAWIERSSEPPNGDDQQPQSAPGAA